MFARCELWQDHVEAGCYPDCDMLPLGMLGGGFGKDEWETNFSHDEQWTMLTLWCLFGSPLMVGAELTKLDDWTLSLLTNQEVLAMLTPDCRPRQLCRDEEKAVWTAENAKQGTRYITSPIQSRLSPHPWRPTRAWSCGPGRLPESKTVN